MYFINFCMLRKKTPAHIAKQRLKIIISKKKFKKKTPDYLPDLKKDLIKVICKYIHINPNTISMHFEKKNNNTSILELNIILPHEKQQDNNNKNII